MLRRATIFTQDGAVDMVANQLIKSVIRMKSGAPWSVKGIESTTRETAKMAARRAGMTLGEWLNQIIQDRGNQIEVSPADLMRNPDTLSVPETSDLPWDQPIAELHERIDRSEQHSKTILANIDHAVTQIAGRLTGETALGDNSQRGDADLLEQRLDQIEEKANSALPRESLRIIEQAVTDVSTVLNATEARQTKGIETVHESVAHLSDRLTHAEEQIGNAISVLESSGDLNQKTDTNRDTLFTLNEDVAALSASVESDQARTAETLSGVHQNISEIVRSLDETTRSVTELIRQPMEKAENAIVTFAAHVEASEERSASSLKTLEQSINALSSQVDQSDQGTRTGLDELKAEFLSLVDRVSALEQDNEVLKSGVGQEYHLGTHNLGGAVFNHQAYEEASLTITPLEVDATSVKPNIKMVHDVADESDAGAARFEEESKVSDADPYVSLGIDHVEDTENPDQLAQPLAADADIGPIADGNFVPHSPDLGVANDDIADVEASIGNTDVADDIPEAMETFLEPPEIHDEFEYQTTLEVLETHSSDRLAKRLVYSAAGIAAVSIGLFAGWSVYGPSPNGIGPASDRPGFFSSPLANLESNDSNTQVLESPPSSAPPELVQIDTSSDSNVVLETTELDLTKGLIDAAKSGDPKAQFSLGRAFSLGNGVEGSEQEAIAWYRAAANQGLAVSQYLLGTRYERGIGFDRDVKEAAAWYTKAANGGNVYAMHSLAVLLTRGGSVDQDLDAAFRWFKAAAEYGFVDSQYNLGLFYEQGYGTESSLAEAHKWYQAAAQQSDPVAIDAAKHISAQLDNSDLNYADLFLETWHAKPANPVANGRFDMSFEAYADTGQRSRVARVQVRLTELGYNVAATDGILDPSTEAAIRTYQKLINQTETGLVTDELEKRLVKNNP